MPNGAKYIGHPTQWGNPFKIGDELGAVRAVIVKRTSLTHLPLPCKLDASMCVELFKVYAEMKVKDGKYPYGRVSQILGNHDLCCWCKPGEPCHGDVLLELANG